MGLIRLMGGKKAFANKLDSLFNAKPETTGRNQADITGLIGQYAHGNEPSHHMAYLYNYANEPWKTQKRANQIVKIYILINLTGCPVTKTAGRCHRGMF